MARLTGKAALITGAAEGQGVAEAELFVRESAIDGGYFAAGLASLHNRPREDFAAGRN